MATSDSFKKALLERIKLLQPHEHTAETKAIVDLILKNISPVANGDTYTTTIGQPLDVSVSVLANDTGANKLYMPLRVEAKTIASARGGTVEMKDDGKFTYTPKKCFVGTDEFQYEAIDNRGAKSLITTVTVNVVLGTVWNNDNGCLALEYISDSYSDTLLPTSTLMPYVVAIGIGVISLGYIAHALYRKTNPKLPEPIKEPSMRSVLTKLTASLQQNLSLNKIDKGKDIKNNLVSALDAFLKLDDGEKISTIQGHEQKFDDGGQQIVGAGAQSDDN